MGGAFSSADPGIVIHHKSPSRRSLGHFQRPSHEEISGLNHPLKAQVIKKRIRFFAVKPSVINDHKKKKLDKKYLYRCASVVQVFPCSTFCRYPKVIIFSQSNLISSLLGLLEVCGENIMLSSSCVLDPYPTCTINDFQPHLCVSSLHIDWFSTRICSNIFCDSFLFLRQIA